MNKKLFFLLAMPFLACACSSDPGVNAPPDPPVTQAQIDKMSPAQKAGYDQAMKSKDQAMAATQGKGPRPTTGNGQ